MAASVDDVIGTARFFSHGAFLKSHSLGCCLFPAASIFAIVFPIQIALASTTVQSLSGVRGAMKTDDAKRMFDRDMNGVPQPDGLGTTLPAGVTKEFLVQQLAPGRAVRNLVLAGIKTWPQRPHGYVAMICLADSPELAASARKYPPVECNSFGDDDSARHVWFGVFEKDEAGVFRLIARTDGPVTTPTRWTGSNIAPPMDLEMSEDPNKTAMIPSSWSRFDLAAYELRAGEYAFGVRAGWSEGYSGGGADFEALYLFAVEGASLRVVFAQPMAFSKMIAGDWHKDGTREHDVSDAADALVVLPTTTDGYHDLQLREKGGRWRRTFKWSPVMHGYAPAR